MTRSEVEAIATLKAQMGGVLEHLERHGKALEALLEASRVGKEDRAAMREDIQEMKPHIETIARAKVVHGFLARVGAMTVKVGSIIAAIVAFFHFDPVSYFRSIRW